MASPGGGLEGADVWGASTELAELADLTTEQIATRTRIQTNNARAIQSEIRSVEQQLRESDSRVKDNLEKIKLNMQLPYMVANVVEVSLRRCLFELSRREGLGLRPSICPVAISRPPPLPARPQPHLSPCPPYVGCRAPTLF